MDHVGVLLSKIKKIPQNTNGRLAIPALAGLLVKILMIDDVTLWSKLESAWFSRFINSISETDDNQDVSARTVGGKVHGPFSAWGGVII